MPKVDVARLQPGMRSVYGGTIIDRGSTDPVRVIPTLCGRCGGHGRLGEELFCPVCCPEVRNYEPYFAEDDSTIKHQAMMNRSRFAGERGRHPAHPKVQQATGVRTRSAGRRK